MSAPKPRQARGGILVIEPDSSRAATLRDILRQHDSDLEIVESVAAALRSLAAEIPDLLLTSTFLPPVDEALLNAHLRAEPAAAHLQTVTVPYFIDSESAPRSWTTNFNVLDFRQRRAALIRPRCDVRTLREQIEEYLSQARTIRQEMAGRPWSKVSRASDNSSPEPDHGMWLTRISETPGALAAASHLAQTRQPVPGMPADRRRARRRPASDVPWLWTVKLPWGAPVSLVDISSGGVLLETTSRLTDGSTIDLQLLGQDTNVCVPARMIRSQVAAVDSLGVRYRVAATFGRDLDLLGLQAPSAPLMPKLLADLLTRVLGEIDRGSGASALRVRFEQELRRLLPVRDIQIRQTPLIAEQGADSIYFTVPQGSDNQPILQAIFEPGYAPTIMEFRLLKAAASLAAVVLELAPLSEAGAPRYRK